MRRLSSVLLGLFDGMLPSLMSIYLTPIYGNLSNLYQFVSYLTVTTNYSAFYVGLLSAFLLITRKWSSSAKYIITLFTPLILKYLGHYFLEFDLPEALPNGILFMSIMQSVILLLHYCTSIAFISSKFLYFSFFILGLNVRVPFSPKQVHAIFIGYCYILYICGMEHNRSVRKSRSKSNLKIVTQTDSHSFLNFIKVLAQIAMPMLAYWGNIFVQNELTSHIGIVASQFSTKTGLIQVLHHPDHNMRTLRAGHSLIGGMYDNGDCIWGSFYFHEFSRLIRRPNADTLSARYQKVVSLYV
eukprot:NODE_194_length_15414_cov_0.324127.p6 type:complete len:299 gc:universal NODE_194_length_15414_cov_0.324127:10446-11342(+)